MRLTRSTKYRLQLIILIVAGSLFALFLYTHGQQNKDEEEYIEKHEFASKKVVSIEYTPMNETTSPDSENCAYKVKITRN